MSLSSTAMAADEASAKQTTNYQELTQDELVSLQNKEAQSPELLGQMAAGCKEVWSNDAQKYKTICYNPEGAGRVMGVGLGFLGFLFGSFGGAPGAIAGGVVGYYLGYEFGYRMEDANSR